MEFPIDNVGSAYKNQDCKREYEIKSNEIKTTIMISDHLNDQLIQGFSYFVKFHFLLFFLTKSLIVKDLEMNHII